MVQRKVGSKLGIQADHVNKPPEKRLGSLKAGFSHHQDGRNRAADMKKKMKKSRSIKLSDIDSLRSSPLQPGKPPPVIRPSDGSPNYMKSTSSSDARKERSQVSPRISQTGSSGGGRRLSSNSEVCSASAHKTARTTSLKLVKTLTKSPSFKPVRASTKKCSKVALCADMGAHKHRATCSSTLKDSKFPEYLMLNPGGTEYEGTSVIKVCPYTYCSLNGHHHAPLPPLKCFLSARRRALKTQKTMKLEALSPRRDRRSGDSVKAIDTGQVIIDGKHTLQEVDSGSSAVSPLILQEVGMDFFVEIYAKSRDETYEAIAIGSSTADQDGEEIVEGDAGETGHLKNTFSSVEGDDGLVADSESDESPPVSEIDSGDDLDQDSNIVFAETSSEGDQMAEEADEDYPPSLAQGYRSDGWESKSEASDMDWEEATQYPDDSTQGNDEDILDGTYLLEIKHPDLHDVPPSKPDGTISKGFEEVFSEAQQEVIDDESSCFEVQFSGSDSDADSIDQNLETDESSQMSESPNEEQEQEQSSSIFEEVAAHEEDAGKTEVIDFINIHGNSCPVEDAIEETAAAADNDKGRVSEAGSLILEMYAQPEDDENCESTQASPDETLLAETQDHQCDKNVEVQIGSQKDQAQVGFKISSSMNLEEHGDSKMKKSALLENSDEEVDNMEVEDRIEPEAAETCLSSNDTGSSKIRTALFPARSNTNQEPVTGCNTLKGAIRRRRPVEEKEELRNFNPREPNYLPLQPDPESEKVDLRHQMMDERKNSEEWMLDFALRKAVTELAPARKRKVALLVEAFETVLPLPKWETRIRHTSSAFAQPRTIQACS